MNISEIQLFSKSLEDVPPGSLLRGATPEQTLRWQFVRRRCSVLRAELTAFFSGEKPPTVEATAKELEFFSLDKQRWIAFYQLIQYAWKYIEDLALELGISLEQYSIETPGKMLAASIEQSAMLHIYPAFAPYFRWTPSEKRKQVKLCKEAIKIEALQASGRRISAKEARKLKEAESVWKKIDRETGNFRRLEQFCLVACWQNQSTDQMLNQHIKSFEVADSKMLPFLECNMLHPRRSVKGEEWRHGQKTDMDKYGGKPVNKASQ